MGDGRVVCFSDTYPAACERLEDGVMGAERRRVVTLQQQPAHPAVQLRGQQQRQHRRLDVLHAVLIRVERVPQVHWDVL